MSESVTLMEWLSSAGKRTVVHLLRARPDLAVPPPQNTRILATRAASRASVARACDRLDAFRISVLEAAVLAAAAHEPAPRSRIAGWLGPDVDGEHLTAAIEELRGLALLYGEDPYAVPAAVGEVLGSFPGGLGAPAADLDDPHGQLAALSEGERKLVETLAAGPPIGQTREAAQPVPIEQARTPIQSLLARGLLLRRDAETVELPRQLALAVRGEHPMGTIRPEPPALPTHEVGRDRVDGTAAGEAAGVLRQLETTIEAWSQAPPSLLRSGGIAVRDLRRLAKELDEQPERVNLLVELLVGAGLAGADQDNGVWVPTTAADGWLADETPGRWAKIARAWLDLPRLPYLAGQRDAKDRTIGPLAGELYRPDAPQTRRMTLHAIAELAEGTALDGYEPLTELLNWRTPRQAGKLRDRTVEATIGEANALGVLAMGACSTPGRALLNEPERAAAAMAATLPEPVNHVLVQPDLTVVAPGPLERELGKQMDLVGDVESAGGATVYRIGEAGVRRALDAGRTPAELHELFERHSATAVPQSLSYLIDDVARRHGLLRGGAAGSFLRSDDPALLAEVLAGPAARKLELRKIAAEVVISPRALVDVLDVLREHGYAPVAEGSEGQLLDLRPDGRRIPARSAGREQGHGAEPPDQQQLSQLVDAMHAADRAAAAKRGAARSAMAGAGASDSLSTTLSALREAVRARETVWIGLVDSRGTASQHVLVPARIGGGVVEGEDPDTGEPTRLPLHLITTVAAVTE